MSQELCQSHQPHRGSAWDDEISTPRIYSTSTDIPVQAEIKQLWWDLQVAMGEITILKALAVNWTYVPYWSHFFSIHDLQKDSAANILPRSPKRQCLAFPRNNTVVDVPPAIDMLPTEVMGEIFLSYLALGNPMILCWVCHKWRSIGMSMVKLWARPTFVMGSVFFPMHPDSDYTGTRESEYVQEMCRWIHRGHHSGAVFLTLLRASRNNHRWKESFFLESLIRPYAGFFESLELDVTQGQLSTLLDGQSNFSGLKSLSLHLPFLALDDWPWHQGMSASAPCLDSLTISAENVAPALGLSGFTTCFPWSQLTTLDMEHIHLGVEMWRHILVKCAPLRAGSFTLDSCPHGPRESITLHHLISLNIKFKTRDQIQLFDVSAFDSMSFPVLQALQITALVDWSDSHPFVDWMRRQSGMLRVLTLEVRLPDDIMLDMLRSFPNVQKLTMYLHHAVVECCNPVFQAVQDGHMPQLELLTVRAGAPYNTSSRLHWTSPILLHSSVVFELVKVATTWAALGRMTGWGFEVFAEEDILMDVRDGICAVDSTVNAVLQSSVPSLGIGRYHSERNFRDERNTSGMNIPSTVHEPECTVHSMKWAGFQKANRAILSLKNFIFLRGKRLRAKNGRGSTTVMQSRRTNIRQAGPDARTWSLCWEIPEKFRMTGLQREEGIQEEEFGAVL
ncbi:hypothetical protein B0H11DRAFT_1915006 [Mycena galericulata]|nr:hypothetical protein B0H11DRAFT_1915006 [Mycena galericulata]